MVQIGYSYAEGHGLTPIVKIYTDLVCENL